MKKCDTMRCKLGFSTLNDLRDEGDENGKMALSGNYFRWFQTGIGPTAQQTKQNTPLPKPVSREKQHNHDVAVNSPQNDRGNGSFLIGLYINLNFPAGRDKEVLKYARQGIVIPGMSKQEVILTYGIACHSQTRTPSTSSLIQT